MTSIPPLVAAATTPAADRERLVAALERTGAETASAGLRDEFKPRYGTTLITGFARVKAEDYGVLAASARRTDALGYARLQ